MAYKNGLSSWVRGYIFKFWYVFVVAFLFVLIGVGLQLLTPLPIKALADYIFGDLTPPFGFDVYSKETLLLWVVVAFFAIAILQSALGILGAYVIQRLNQLIDKRSMLDVFTATLQIPANHPERLSSGRYVYEITSQSQQLSGYILGSFITIVRSLVTIIGVLAVLLNIDWRMTVICLASIPFLVGCVKIFGNLIETISGEVERHHSKIYEYIGETMTKIRTAQVFAKEHVRQAGLIHFIRIRNRSANKRLLVNESFGISTQLVVLIAVGVVLWIGGKNVLRGSLSFGDLLLFTTYMGSIFGPLTAITEVFGSIRQQKAALSQAFDTLETAERLRLPDGTIENQQINGKIEFQNVKLVQKGRTILEDVNLTIPPRSVVAFVGPSGQGKSSLLNMVIRMVQPESGWVKIDDIDIRDFKLETLRKQVAVIEQEPDIFNMSVAHNVLMGRPDEEYPLPDIMGALEVANANEFVDKLKDKYDTIVDAGSLSGGQKQRIAVARAVYKHNPIVLMDEPTSALDEQSAHIFIDNLFKYLHNGTVLLVTHDLRLLERVNTIYVVNDKTVKPISDYGGLEAYKAHLENQ